MNARSMGVSISMGVATALFIALPLSWLPILMMRQFSDLWLAVLTLLPVAIGGYMSARRALNPIRNGTVTGLVATLVMVLMGLTSDEWWAIPVMLALGGAIATMGAYCAVWLRHTASQPEGG